MSSIQDYAALERHDPDVRPYGLQRSARDRFLAVQVWEWDGDCSDLRVYFTEDATDDAGAGACYTRVLRSRYYAVTIARLLELLGEAGFVEGARRDDVLFQPVFTGCRAAAA